MKKIKINNFLKGTVSVFLVAGMVYAAGGLSQFGAGEALTETKINALVDKINALEQQLENNVYTKTETDQKISTAQAVLSDGIVTRKNTTNGTSCSFSDSRTTCTIENLVIGKPLYLMLDTRGNSGPGSILYYRVISGTDDGATNASNITYMLSAHAFQNGPRGAGHSAIIIPTETTVKINLWTHAEVHKGKIHVYQ